MSDFKPGCCFLFAHPPSSPPVATHPGYFPFRFYIHLLTQPQLPPSYGGSHPFFDVEYPGYFHSPCNFQQARPVTCPNFSYLSRTAVPTLFRIGTFELLSFPVLISPFKIRVSILVLIPPFYLRRFHSTQQSTIYVVGNRSLLLRLLPIYNTPGV
jgi:hypothetical protein